MSRGRSSLVKEQFSLYDDANSCALQAVKAFAQRGRRWGQTIPTSSEIVTQLEQMKSEAQRRWPANPEMVIRCGRLIYVGGRYGHERDDWESPLDRLDARRWKRASS